MLQHDSMRRTPKAGIKAAMAAAAALAALFIAAPARAEALASEFGVKHSMHEAALKPLKIGLARKDPNAFIEYCATFKTKAVKQAHFHYDIQRLIGLDTGRSVVIAVPRGHGKTVQVAWRIVWEIGRDCNIRVKIIGSVDDKAEEILGLVQEIIENNSRVREVFPHLCKLKGTKSEFWVKRTDEDRNPTVQASGVLSAGAGGRADLLVFDDVVDASNALSNPGMRQKVKDAIDNIWLPLISADGKFVWICTPYHIDDASHALKSKASTEGIFDLYWEPAVKSIEHLDPISGELLSKEDIILWPEMWPLEKLEQKRREIGERAYTRQYLLNAMSDEERTYGDAALKRSGEPDLDEIGYYLDAEGYKKKIPKEWATFGGVDLASTKGNRSAWTVIITLAFDPDEEKLYIKDMVRKQIGMEKTISELLNQYELHAWVSVFVENNNYQRVVADSSDLHDKAVPVEGFTTGTNKYSEEIGLPSMEVAFERGIFALPFKGFPYQEGDTNPAAQILWELQTHPNGKFSDIVMALWFAYQAFLKTRGDYEESYAMAAGM